MNKSVEKKIKKGTRLVNCLLPLHFKEPLTYIWPFRDRKPIKGARLLLPLRNRKIIGICWEETEESPLEVELKEVIDQLDDIPLFPEKLFDFLNWASNYYFYPIGKAVAEALPPEFISARKKAAQRIAEGSILPGRSKLRLPQWKDKDFDSFSREQEEAIEKISHSLKGQRFDPILLFGVTGSGKTAVYIEAAKRCLELDRNCLVMVPEISMTSQLAGRFRRHFENHIAIIHSGLTPAQRRDEWWRLRTGDAKIALGTRSSIFSPISNLGLIVVDEEHDPSYKQEERFRYNARDLALIRGKMEGATVVLGSGTPSIQSFFHAKKGKYKLIYMKERVPGATLPTVEIVDRRKEQKDKRKGKKKKKKFDLGWLSPELKTAIEKTLERKEQVLLFLNRRGFATFVFCPSCGHVFKCKSCDVTLSWHRRNKALIKKEEIKELERSSGILSCHYCGETFPALPTCPSCKGQAVRTEGFGTEKIAEEFLRYFPDATVARIDRDTLGRKREFDKILSAFRKGEIDCLVGTQMITKGHDFPNLTLVGIIWADMSLNLPEFNASERTFQLLSQVAGRAGRQEKKGQVILQTFMPDSYTIQFSMRHDFLGFFKKELELREKLKYPPFSRFVNVKLSGPNKSEVERYSGLIASRVRDFFLKKGIKETKILGPVICPKTKIKSRFRFQILLKGELKELRLACGIINELKEGILPSTIHLEIDVDPLNFI